MSHVITRPWTTGSVRFFHDIAYTALPPGWVWADGVAPGAPDWTNRFPLIFGRISGTTAESDIDGVWESTGGNTQHYHSFDWNAVQGGSELYIEETTDWQTHIPKFVVFGAAVKL